MWLGLQAYPDTPSVDSRRAVSGDHFQQLQLPAAYIFVHRPPYGQLALRMLLMEAALLLPPWHSLGTNTCNLHRRSIKTSLGASGAVFHLKTQCLLTSNQRPTCARQRCARWQDGASCPHIHSAPERRPQHCHFGQAL